MTPDELRALADALQHDTDELRNLASGEITAADEAWFAMHDKAIDYLRACADAQPVAWIARNLTTGRVKWTTDRCRARGWTRDANLRVKLLYAHPAPAALAIEERGPWFAERDQQRAWVDSDDFTHDARLYVNGDFESNDQRFAYAQEIARRLNAAPAAPQAEPKRELTAGEQDVLDSALRSSVKLVARGVAEPKREPLSDEQIDVALQTDPAMILALMSGDLTVGEFKSALRRVARTVERAHGISGGRHD